MMPTALETGASASAKPSGLRILLVEDHDDSRELMAEILRRTGEHSIAFVTRADEGLRHLRDAVYDLIVTDIGLPDGSGLEMLDEARAEGLLVTTSVVVWSAMGWLRPEARARGAQFIPKPVDVDQVFDMMQRVHAPTHGRGPESGVELGEPDKTR